MVIPASLILFGPPHIKVNSRNHDGFIAFKQLWKCMPPIVLHSQVTAQ